MMRIGMLAPIWETTPPVGYGGIELVVHLLTQGLVEAGHHVTLFATGDSKSAAEPVFTEPVALRQLGYDTWSLQMAEVLHLSQAYLRHREFDLLHNHLGPLGAAFAEVTGARAVTTLHGPLLPENERYHRAFARHPFVSISFDQRRGCPELNYAANIYNGIETRSFGLGPKQGYLLFLGRISPEKGTHLAIEAALKADLPLVIAAKIDPYDRAYYERQIAPQIDGERVRFIGEVHGARKREVLQGAIALLHLVQWPEPFGLVMAEAMASGTPVVAMPMGSIPEVVTHGRTGFIVRSVDEAVEAIARLEAIAPETCRQEAVARFDVARMVEEYLALYEAVAFAPVHEADHGH